MPQLEANKSKVATIEGIWSARDKTTGNIDDNAQVIDIESELSVDIVNETFISIEKIAEEIGFISDFPTITNILAINAAIEAARASDQDKSFGVVSNHLKYLANQSQIVALNIKKSSSSGLD